MKKLLALFIAISMVLTFAACNTSEQEVESQESAVAAYPEASASSGEQAQESEGSAVPAPSEEEPQMSDSLLALTMRPVDAQSDMLIAQNDTDQQYGLYDMSGEEILPCEYGDMAFITVNSYDPKVYVAAQSKGSYGIYDLSGAEIVSPSYDKIVGGADYADCIIVEKNSSNGTVCGAVDLQGNEIIPVQYADITSSPQGLLGAVTRGELGEVAQDGTVYAYCNVDLYESDGTLQNSFQAELVRTGSISGGEGETTLEFFNWGTLICIESNDGRYTFEQRFELDGSIFTGIKNTLPIDTPYFEYLNGNTLSFMDGSTGEEVISIELQLPEGTLADLSVYAGIEGIKTDAANGDVTGAFYIRAVKDNAFVQIGELYLISNVSAQDYELYLVSLGSAPSISPMEKDYKEIGLFYDGRAFAVTADDKICTLDAAGNAVELSAPFTPAPLTEPPHYFLYEGCAVLDNNGYIYVVNKDGDTILSEDGYTGIAGTSPYSYLGGLIVLTASDGSTQLIDTYGNEVVPQGNSYQQAALYDPQGEENEAYSLIQDTTAGRYVFVDNENNRALENHREISEDFAAKLFAGQGWVLWDDLEERLIAVVAEEDGYQVQDVARKSIS